MGKNKLKKRKQSGILPYRIEGDRIEIMLVSTSSGKHWTIPKGNIKKDLGGLESALEEGWEEAGIKGNVHQRPLGKFSLKKRGELLSVKVFLCRVTEEWREFPEREYRRRKWTSPEKAAQIVKHDGLKKLLSGLEQALLPPNPPILNRKSS